MSDWFSFAVPVLESATYAARVRLLELPLRIRVNIIHMNASEVSNGDASIIDPVLQEEVLAAAISVGSPENRVSKLQDTSKVKIILIRVAFWLFYADNYRENEALRTELEQLRHDAGRIQDNPGSAINGKRRRVEEQQLGSPFVFDSGLTVEFRYERSNAASLSPRSVVTPVGPDRLTLGPGQRQSNFSSRHSTNSLSDNAVQSRPTELRLTEGRVPGHSIQYADNELICYLQTIEVF